MSHPGITVFLADTDEFVVTETARAINDDLSIEAALPALGDLLNTTRFRNEALIRRSISANLRTGSEKAMQNLADYVANAGNQVGMRTEAIAALGVWARPSVLDRVDGRLRGTVERDPALLKSRFEKVFLGLLDNADPSIRLSATQAVSKLQLISATPILLAQLKKDVKPELRREALKALVALNYTEAGLAIKQALSDKEKMVRITGIDLLSKSSVSPELTVNLLADVINTKSTEEKQAALLTLGKMPLALSKKVLDEQLDKMAKGNLPAEIFIELSEAIDSTKDAGLIARYKTISRGLSPDEITASYAGSLYGGDPDRGRTIFYEGEGSQCIRCHVYNDIGGNAGPRLNGIASRLTREQLLEALIKPSARLAPGYGMITIETKDGKTIAGILEEETNTALKVRSGDQAPAIIKKDQLVKRTNGNSGMPEMRYLLKKKEIRDVVAFLATLKE
jgi:putative heme-binding domain-containing protein